MDACLAGETVAFTGRLTSLTRAEAQNLVRHHGGDCARSVTAETTLLVIGQEGWPLQADGSVTRKLRTARKLIDAGCAITILTEEEWLRRLNLKAKFDEASRHLSSAELSQLLGVPRDQLRTWVRAGFVTPIQQVSGVTFFGFREASGVRLLRELVGRGVSTERIKHSLKLLSSWMPDAERSLLLLERDGRLLVRLNEAMLAEPSGQLCWEFSDETCVVVTLEEPTPSAHDWFERGWSHEQAGRLQEAAEAYRQALLGGEPNAQICFNLGNVLYSLGCREAAAERFWQAVELDPRDAAAWNNLGNVLVELGKRDEAATAYERAITADPTYAEVHYNFADLLAQINRQDEAARHWREFLRLEMTGPWSDYARRQLASSAFAPR